MCCKVDILYLFYNFISYSLYFNIKIPCYVHKSKYSGTEHEKKMETKIYPKNKMAANEKYKQYLKYLGGIIFHGLEYLIRHEVVFCFII